MGNIGCMAYDRPPAPGELARIEDFCNSARFLYGEDALAGLDTARGWLRANGHARAAGAIDEPARAGLVTAREAVRDLLAGDRSAGTLHTLNDRARTALGPPRWTEAGVELGTDDGEPVTTLVGDVLAALATAALTGADTRLKVCAGPDCRWVFYDRSPANRGVWCSMDICGARHKMRAYRDRNASR
jgi:predicted RNA-binding Zn ribbon-like protein